MGDSHTHLHTLSVHSPVFHRLCCTSYSPLSSPSACSQICDSSVRSSDIQVPVCLPLPHSSPGPVGPSQLQNGAGPPKNGTPARRGFHFTGHTKPSARAFLMKILSHFIDAWSYRLNMNLYNRLLMGTHLIFWSFHSFNIICMSKTHKTKRNGFANTV